MFLGRKEELKLLEEMYASEKFEFLVLYGRRRVGKTSLLREFYKSHGGVFFSAQEKNDTLNLEDFSKTAQGLFEQRFFGTFSNWEAAFEYVGSKCNDEKLLIIIDEFPFIAGENPSVKSILQHTIDYKWKEKKIFLILCGSSVSFMENEVMGYKSPLYGRATAQLEVQPFDYFDSGIFFPEYSNEEKLLAYGILGGIPCYLQAFSDKENIQDNIARRILKTGSFLKDEPQLLLKMELREPAVYNSIFEAIAGGASRMNEISQKIHEESQKCAKYINTLRNIRLLNKITPCGEPESSKKSIYAIADNYYAFWYHYVFANRSYYEMMGEESAAEEIMEPESISDYMGHVFESICLQYMIRQAKNRRLPFVPYEIGKWWGNNPMKRSQDDIDILAFDKKRQSAIFCECKYKNEAFDKKEYEDLMCASNIFTEPQKRYYYVFSKGGYTEWVKMEAKKDDVCLLEIDDLFTMDCE
ncbi:MAG: ATP-binding protein [Lachnospiraceae bacterium]|nr:ATP-binding protein [Lachnospiraceae bacterium]